MAYGIKIGKNEFTDFTIPKFNTYGVANQYNEIPIESMAIYEKSEYWNAKQFTERFDAGSNRIVTNIPDSYFIALDDNLEIRHPAIWSVFSTTFWITGNVYITKPLQGATASYGAQINGKTIPSTNRIIYSNRSVHFNQGVSKDAYGQYVNLKSFMEQLLKIVYDANTEFDIDIRTGNVSNIGKAVVIRGFDWESFNLNVQTFRFA